MNYYYIERLCFWIDFVVKKKCMKNNKNNYENVEKLSLDPSTSYLQSERSNRVLAMPVEFVGELIIEEPFSVFYANF